MSAQVNKRGSESKYVSLFADSRPDVDVTFRDPLLTRPTSHYVVGVDNLTVCSKALSMIEPVVTANHTDLIRVVRKPQYQAGGGGNRGISKQRCTGWNSIVCGKCAGEHDSLGVIATRSCKCFHS